MLNGLLHAHSGFRWILLILLIATIFNSYSKWKSNAVYGNIDNKLSLFTMIFTHIQLLIGLYLFFASPRVKLSGLDMGNSFDRFFTIEHLLGMLIAIALITIGRIQSKKMTTDTLKHKKTFVMYFIAFIIMLLSIPWPFRGFGNAWF